MEENNEEKKVTENTDTGAENNSSQNTDEQIIAQQQSRVEQVLSDQQDGQQTYQQQAASAQPQPEAAAAPVKKAKVKKPLPKYLVPCLGLVLTIIISFCCGYFGASLANKNNSGSNSVVVYQNTDTPVNVTSTSDSTDVSAVVSAVADSVVEVYTENTTYSSYYGNYVTEGAGSGVIYTTDGYIITNNHVIEDATSIKVTLHNGDSYDATLVATAATADIAVIKIEATGLKPVVLGDSDDLAVGQVAIAIGNPLGTLGGTVSTGIVSALSREVTIDGQTMTLLQTTAAINPGNSGGGLFNAAGQLIGIVNAKSSATEVEGIGFAIPVNVVKTVAEQLISQGYVSGRPIIGITGVSIENIQTAWKYNVSNYGVYVTAVTGTNAAEAGLQAGDLITGMDDATIASYSDLTAALSTHSAGDEVTIKVLRNKETITITMVLEEKTGSTANNG